MIRKYLLLPELIFLIAFPGIIGISHGYQAVGIPISPAMDDLPETEEISAGKHLVDSVYLFEPFQDLELIPINLTKDRIYYISIKSYVPYDPSFFIDVRIESPAEFQYYFFEENSAIHLNETYWYFEYGAAETGEHILKLLVETEAPLTLHILVKEALDLVTYYSRNQFDSIVPSDMAIAEIRHYGQTYLTTEYTFQMIDDTEYFFNFFRVNMLNYEARRYIDYINPTVKLDLMLNGTPFAIYPELQTQNYSLSTNVDHMGEVEFWNEDTEVFLPDLLDHPLFHISFGSFTTANATLTLTFDLPSNPLLFNMNFAFMVYAIGAGKIGDGSDDLPPITTSPFNATDPDENDNLYNDSVPGISVLDRMIFAVQIFLVTYFDQTLMVVGSLLVVSVVTGQVFTANRLKKETIGKKSTDTERPKEDV